MKNSSLSAPAGRSSGHDEPSTRCLCQKIIFVGDAYRPFLGATRRARKSAYAYGRTDCRLATFDVAELAGNEALAATLRRHVVLWLS